MPPPGSYATWSHIKRKPTDKFTIQRINFPPIRELVATYVITRCTAPNLEQPPKQASNISEAVKKGMQKMFTFFKPVPAPLTPTTAGRKKRHAGGRPSTSTVAGGAPPVPPVPPPPPALPVASNDAVAEPAAKKAKKRANYDVPGLHKDRMDAAMDEWVNGVKPEDFATGKEVSMNKFVGSKRLPPSQRIGSAGRPPCSGGEIAAPAPRLEAIPRWCSPPPPRLVFVTEEKHVNDDASSHP